jgi:hypothetical protein
VEGGVEAGDGGHAGEHCLHGVQGGQRLGLVQWRQVGQRLKPLPDLVVYLDWGRVEGAAVHDPVADGVDRAERLDRGLDRGGVCRVARCGQVSAGRDRVGRVKHAQFQAA